MGQNVKNSPDEDLQVNALESIQSIIRQTLKGERIPTHT